MATLLSCNPAFDCAEITKEAVDVLVAKWEESPLIQKMNGRAFHKYIYPTFVESHLRQLKMAEKKKGFQRTLRLTADRMANRGEGGEGEEWRLGADLQYVQKEGGGADFEGRENQRIEV